MQTIRTINAYLIAPALMLTGFRFSKEYRHGVSRFHRAVYAAVDTVGANHIAGL
jgi:hypothetical protein